MVKGLIVTHGDLGQAFLRVVERFLGPQPNIDVVSNDDLSIADLRSRIASEVRELGARDELFLFADLDGGSCGNACAFLARTDSRLFGVSGLNLPMLVEFCHYRGRLSGECLLERLTRKGRDGVVVSRGDAS